MTNYTHFEVLHEFFCNRIWCADYDLVYVLDIVVEEEKICLIRRLSDNFRYKLVDYLYLPCKREHSKHAHGCSLLGNWIPCTC